MSTYVGAAELRYKAERVGGTPPYSTSVPRKHQKRNKPKILTLVVTARLPNTRINAQPGPRRRGRAALDKGGAKVAALLGGECLLVRVEGLAAVHASGGAQDLGGAGGDAEGEEELEGGAHFERMTSF